MLCIKNIYKSFGGLKAINNVSLEIEKSSITALIGPNGAGKTTLFNIINGSIKPDSGIVELNEIDITGYEPHQLFNLGILRTFQIAHEFSSLTVKDNLMMVPPNQTGESLLQTWFSPKKIKGRSNARNPRSGEIIKTSDSKSIAFKMSKKLKQEINNIEREIN